MQHPRKIAALFAMLMAFVFSPALAADAAHSPAVHGTWSKAQPLPDGRSLLVVMTFHPDMTFSGNASIGGAVVWEYAGAWESDGSTLTYHYQQSSRPLPESARTDVDDVVSVSPESLVLRSRASGQTHAFARKN